MISDKIALAYGDGGILSIFTVIVVLGFSYVLGQTFFNLYLSPLAKFPGPRVVIITRWYEAYYEIILKGKYEFKIREWHDKYGALSSAKGILRI